MNNEQLPFQKLDAYQVAKELAARLTRAAPSAQFRHALFADRMA